MLGDVREREREMEREPVGGGRIRERERYCGGMHGGSACALPYRYLSTGVVGSFHSLFFFVIYFRKQLFHPNYCIRRTKFVSAVVSSMLMMEVGR